MQVYDEEGNLQTLMKFINDDRGNIVEADVYGKDGNFLGKVKIIYDHNGYELEHTEYDSVGIVNRKRIYTADEKGRMIEITSFDAQGKIKDRMTYEYNKNDHCVKEHNRTGTKTYTYELDNQGNWIKALVYSNNSLYQIIERRIIYYE